MQDCKQESLCRGGGVLDGVVSRRAARNAQIKWWCHWAGSSVWTHSAAAWHTPVFKIHWAHFFSLFLRRKLFVLIKHFGAPRPAGGHRQNTERGWQWRQKMLVANLRNVYFSRTELIIAAFAVSSYNNHKLYKSWLHHNLRCLLDSWNLLAALVLK